MAKILTSDNYFQHSSDYYFQPANEVWTDFPKSPRNFRKNDGWFDAERISPKNTPKKPTCKQSFELQQHSPRTSTPVTNQSSNTTRNNSMINPYDSWKKHLHENPTNLKIRGGNIKNQTIISGHIDMKDPDPFSYTYEQHVMPKVNKCFINLLLNGPAPLICQEHYDPNYKNPWVANCDCIPVCNCRANLATRSNLPVKYKYDKDGFVVPTKPPMKHHHIRRDPTCIYTK